MQPNIDGCWLSLHHSAESENISTSSKPTKGGQTYSKQKHGSKPPTQAQQGMCMNTASQQATWYRDHQTAWISTAEQNASEEAETDTCPMLKHW
jgi:hypothetical protein